MTRIVRCKRSGGGVGMIVLNGAAEGVATLVMDGAEEEQEWSL